MIASFSSYPLMDTRLLELLVCPLCKGPLQLVRETQQLVCHADRLGFPVHDGVPVMVESQALPLPPETGVTPPAASGPAGAPPGGP